MNRPCTQPQASSDDDDEPQASSVLQTAAQSTAVLQQHCWQAWLSVRSSAPEQWFLGRMRHHNCHQSRAVVSIGSTTCFPPSVCHRVTWHGAVAPQHLFAAGCLT